MIYPYGCSCGRKFDVTKSIHNATDPERCACGEIAQRIFVAPMISGSKIFEAEYYPALGKVITNKKELQNEMARRDIVQIGNDWGTGEKMQTHFDKQRQENREKAWDKALENISL